MAIASRCSPAAGFDPTLPVLQPDGRRKPVDIRTLPFLRFEKNEAHCMRFFGLNLGGFNDGGVPAYPGEKAPATAVPPAIRTVTRREKIEDVEGVGPDPRHPFLIRDFLAWDAHWAFHAGSPSVRAEGMDLYDSQYGIWRSVIDHHEYANLHMEKIISRGIFFPRPGRARTDEIAFLSPVDDLPPATVITGVSSKDCADSAGRIVVRGSCCDDYTVKRVVVNNREARPTRANFLEWEVEIDAPRGEIVAFAEDQAGNVEKTPHVIHPGSLPAPRHEPDGRDAPDLARRRPRSGRPVPQGLSGTDRASEGRPDARGIGGCAVPWPKKASPIRPRM